MAVLTGLASCKREPALQPSRDMALVPHPCAPVDGGCPLFGPKDGGVDCVVTINEDSPGSFSPDPSLICIPQGRQLKFDPARNDVVVTSVSGPFEDPVMKPTKPVSLPLKIREDADAGRYKYCLHKTGTPAACAEGGTEGKLGELEVVPETPTPN